MLSYNKHLGILETIQEIKLLDHHFVILMLLVVFTQLAHHQETGDAWDMILALH
jgi:hypothetical protein